MTHYNHQVFYYKDFNLARARVICSLSQGMNGFFSSQASRKTNMEMLRFACWPYEKYIPDTRLENSIFVAFSAEES